ncbi:MAG: imidazole glycerol phosphate synthase subunit HisH [Candidatus Roizmanbacteria bacterium]|nr:imidazole glycerol phosphate synthase subunit HisH [Candidatus Roizmanbacteria bacterium]
MITIIDYGLGNLGSVKNALDKLGINSLISKSTTDIEKADGLIFPGVGAAGEGMKNITREKLDKIIKQEVSKGKPILGICLGMQLFMSRSEEGNVNCLNIVEGLVQKFMTQLKVPQIGWNTVQIEKDAKLFVDIPQNSYFYFVHSYYCLPTNKVAIGKTTYETQFCSALQKDNIYGVQFHPEKSGSSGLQLLKNFTKIVYENNTSN